MKKILLTLSALCLFSTVCVGKINNVDNAIVTKINLFFSLEGAYNWRAITGAKIRDVIPKHSTQPWGGRAALGTTIPWIKNLSFTNEIGWGYYGKTTISAPKIYKNDSSMDGIDLLVGALYASNKVALFAEFGGVLQNLYTYHQTLKDTAKDSRLVTTLSVTNTQTQILPEIKLGAIYGINKHLGITLAYTRAFSTNLLVIASAEGTVQRNDENPTVSNILLGLRYNL